MFRIGVRSARLHGADEMHSPQMEAVVEVRERIGRTLDRYPQRLRRGPRARTFREALSWREVDGRWRRDVEGEGKSCRNSTDQPQRVRQTHQQSKWLRADSAARRMGRAWPAAAEAVGRASTPARDRDMARASACSPDPSGPDRSSFGPMSSSCRRR